MKSLLVICMLLFCLPFGMNSQPSTDEQVVEINQILQAREQDGEAILPNGSSLVKLEVKEDSLIACLHIPLDYLTNGFTALDLEEIIEGFLPVLPEMDIKNIFLRTENADGKFVPIVDFCPKVSPIKAEDLENDDVIPEHLVPKGSMRHADFVAGPTHFAQPSGGLDGKTVWLSAGHGWLWDGATWRTQRGTTHEVVEDFETIESVNYHLLKYLYQAGGNVWTVRERDMNTNEVIVDDESEGYSEVGEWIESSSQGYGSNYRFLFSNAVETGSAKYTPTIPEAGLYWVSTQYRSGKNRSKDVRFKVRHAGGESLVTVNQETHGLTWVHLGQFYFEAGSSGYVEITNASNDVGQAIIADAIRFGGGMGSVTEDNSGISGKARFDEAALYYAQYQGFEGGSNDVSVRPQYAEWELSKGTEEEKNNACYISFHSNACCNGSGTETYMYNGGATGGSEDLREFVHDEIVHDIQEGWDQFWVDRGKKSANFGELRDLSTMPGILIEVAFHDNEQEAEALTTPRFRDLVARATYKGIVKYFANEDGTTPIFLPEKPTHVAVKNNGNGSAILTWHEPNYGGILGDEATGFKVYKSLHGKAFANATATTTGTSYTFNNLAPETTYYFRVAGTNAGGESFPSQVVAMRTPAAGSTAVPILIVDGFDRLDRGSAIRRNEGSILGTVRRLFIDKMNTYDYAYEHAKALSECGYAFDGTTNEAVISGEVDLENYSVLNWFLGEESTSDASLDANERVRLRSYLDGGGNLLISGSEHGYDLARNNGGTDAAFFAEYLKATYEDDDANTYGFVGILSTHLANVNGSFANSTNGVYNVEYPDVIEPTNNSIKVLNYANGESAAIAYGGEDFRVVNFGFPLEAVYDENVRKDLICKSIEYLSQPLYASAGSMNTPKGAMAFPNPCREHFVVDIKNMPSGNCVFVMTDTLGKEVCAMKWSHNHGEEKKIDTKNLAVGLYSYKLQLNDKVIQGQILKQ